MAARREGRLAAAAALALAAAASRAGGDAQPGTRGPDRLAFAGSASGRRVAGGDAHQVFQLTLGVPPRGSFSCELADLEPGLPGPRTVISIVTSAGLLQGAVGTLFVGESLRNGGETSSPVWTWIEGETEPRATASLRTNVPRGLAFGDVIGDPEPDLVMSNLLADEVRIWRGPLGPGERAADLKLPVPRPEGLVLLDLDGDSDLDVLVGSLRGGEAGVRILTNLGGDRFEERPLGGPAPAIEALAAGDVDGDGVVDLLVAGLSDAPSRIVLGGLDGSRRWIARGGFELSSFALGASLGDVDGDGRLDAVLARPLHRGAGEGPGEVAIHLNRGAAFESAPDRTLDVARPFTLAADRDVDQDGHADLIVASWRDGRATSARSSVLFGPGFEREARFEVDDAVSFTHGDVDGDALPDLFFRSASGSRSPLHLLDARGSVRETRWVATRPTLRHAGGEGSAVASDVRGGSTPYSGSALAPAGSLALSVEGGGLVLRVVSAGGRARTASLPLPGPGPWPVRVDWDTGRRTVALTGAGATVSFLAGERLAFADAPALARIGAGPENRQLARGLGIASARLAGE